MIRHCTIIYLPWIIEATAFGGLMQYLTRTDERMNFLEQ